MHTINVSFFSTLCTPYYDNQYNPRLTMSSSTINDAIMHPNAHNTSNGNGNLELWNKGNSDKTINNNPVLKTIYSPSPSLYVEPKSAAFTGFTSNGYTTSSYDQFNVYGSFNKGWNFYCQPNKSGNTIFISALGYRVPDSSTVCVGTDGDYWNAGPTSNISLAHLLGTTSYTIYPQHEYYRSSEFALRCVYE